MQPFFIEETAHGISDVPGFEVAAVGCDIREQQNNRLDLALIYSVNPCSAAGVFTKNTIKAAPVVISQKALQRQKIFHGIIANSGNANACTGSRGYRDAQTMQALAAKAFGVAPPTFFVCSTGRIGRALPMPKIRHGIRDAAAVIGSTPEKGLDTAKAILTSDTREKIVTLRVPCSHTSGNSNPFITLSGIAKGAGMIQPDMATMLAFIATDAVVSGPFLQKILKRAVDNSFNAITVDGDISTNDTVLLLANGVSGVKVTPSQKILLERFTLALLHLCEVLAEKIVSDGEKMSKVVEVIVEGAMRKSHANKIARSIGNSLLVKTSWAGNDPNWGRLMDAAGYAGVPLLEEKVDLAYSLYSVTSKAKPVAVLAKGRPLYRNQAKWKEIVSAPRFTILLKLNLGKSNYRLLSTDLTEAYVNFNKTE